MQDDVIFSSGGIVVTKTLAKFPSTTFPINEIGSVTVVEPDRSGKMAAAAILGFIGICFFVAGFSNGGACFVVAVVLFCVTAIIYLAAKNLPYTLTIRTASGDSRAMFTTNLQHLLQVKEAIETAATMRG